MAIRLKDLAVGTKDLFMLDPAIIREEPGWNVRIQTPELEAHIQQLADSIREIGVQEPVTVYLKDGVPVLTNGHCRLMAVRLAIEEGAEIKAIPARAEERYANDADRVLGMITRNGGKPLSSLEQAEVVKRLLAFGWTEQEVAKKTGYSVTHIANLLRLVAAPAAVRDMVANGEVSARHAIETIRKEGDGATEVLQEAVATAKAEGKTRATGKHMPAREETGRQEKPAGKAGGRMQLSRAYDIVHACNAVALHHMGLRERQPGPPSLAVYSLSELMEAKAVVRAHEDAKPLPRSTTCTCDDRLIAALYVACHYPGEDPEDCNSVITCDGRAVFVLDKSKLPTVTCCDACGEEITEDQRNVGHDCDLHEHCADKATGP